MSVLNPQPFLKAESEIARLKRLHCDSLLVDLLEDRVLCPHCGFPQGYGLIDIEKQTKDLEDRLAEISRNWERAIINELHNYRDNIRYLSAAEQGLLGKIIESHSLPAQITGELVVALNNLFKELIIIELDPEQMSRELFSTSEVMDYPTFAQRLEQYKQNLAAGKDVDRLRIMLSVKGVEDDGA